MDRRSGLKKAHFSSVLINESFYLQKVCFSDREKFSEPYRLPKIEKTQHNDLYESRWKTQHNALYESRWKTQHNALYESRWKLSTTLFMNRVVRRELSFTEDLS